MQIADDIANAAAISPTAKKVVPGVGTVIGGILIYKDVTDDNLSNERKIYRSVVNGVPVAITIAGYFGLSTPPGWVVVGFGAAGAGLEFLYDTANDMVDAWDNVLDSIEWMEDN